MIKNILNRVSAHEYTVTADNNFGLLRKIEGVWKLLDLHGDTMEEHNVLFTFESYKDARSMLKTIDLAKEIALMQLHRAKQAKAAKKEPTVQNATVELDEGSAAEKASRKSRSFWFRKVVSDLIELTTLEESGWVDCGVESMRATKVWLHVTFTGAEAMLATAECLATLEIGDRLTAKAVKKSVKDLRAAAALVV